ncbi:hypothetical protein FNT36_18530 [Hymenobacter setariae]|uniref:Uncharacterized protein n=1 Tax=Hymenobacter setariae TaxID=2594794 RepID=A0A558BSW3_9BACT|nr:hypothetical protein [Hymenobacter setariae]TVT39638.1 hypothetical protein FNT36_18530 [Hymenobacter setariae]
MGVKVIRIYQLDGIVNARLELVGGFFEVEVPAGPVAGGFQNKRLSVEQLAALLGGGSSLAVTLADAQQLRLADPPGVSPNTLYAITGDWNATGTDSTVHVQGVRADAYHRLGVVYDDQGAGQLLEVEVTAGTHRPLRDDVTTYPYLGHGAQGQVGYTDLDTAVGRHAVAEINSDEVTLTDQVGMLDTLLLGNGAKVKLADSAQLILRGHSQLDGVNFYPPAGGNNTGAIIPSPEDRSLPTPFRAYQIRNCEVQQKIIFRGGSSQATSSAVTLINSHAVSITNQIAQQYEVTVYLVGTSSVDVVGPKVKVVQVGGSNAASTYFSGAYSAPASGAQTITASSLSGLEQATKVVSVGVRGVTVSGDPTLDLLPTSAYTFDTGSHTLTVLAAAGIDAGNVLEINWLTGALTAAPAVAMPPGTALLFTQDAEYAPIYSGTFTVDPTGAKVGAVVFVELGAGASQPTLSASQFKLAGGSYVSGSRNEYGFRVAASGKIHYVINQLP